MPWPLSQDYNEAIQNPAICFQDPELRQGTAGTNPLGIPMPRSGNFADVYELRCPGRTFAIKCFTRQVPGLGERYAIISEYLRQARLKFMVDCHYLAEGIRVRGQWYAVLKMEWVEGQLLNDFVRDNLDKPQLLDALGELWARMAHHLRKTDIAHGDLQHGNIILVPSGANSVAVKLVDYDGLWLLPMDGRPPGEVGHPSYQHPQRLRSGAYAPSMDDFSVLSIATALACLKVGGRRLWDRYDNGDNLLFTARDFQQPAESPLFRELLQLQDARSQRLAQALWMAVQGPLEQVPVLEEGLVLQPAFVSTNGCEVQPAAVVESATSPMPAEPPVEKYWQEAVPEEEATAPLVSWHEPGSGMKPALLAVATVAAIVALVTGLVLWAARRDQPQLSAGQPPGREQPDVPKLEKKRPDRPALPPAQPEPPKILTNSIGMKLAYIPPGKFMMDDVKAEPAQYIVIGQREVKIPRGFYMGIYEIAQNQYATVMGDNPSEWKGFNLPVERVTWDEANDFCSKLSELPAEQRAGRAYRLPSEAEWEYAYRAGARTRHYFDPGLTNDYAWTASNARGTTHPVGQLKPNAWGLYDMNGNVWEWCSDSPAEGERVLRGSSLYNSFELLRTYSAPERRTFDFGFRAVCVQQTKQGAGLAPGQRTPALQNPLTTTAECF